MSSNRQWVYRRPCKTVDGKTNYAWLPECACVGYAKPKGTRWTVGRRGPAGGVCGACNGAIPGVGEAGQLVTK